MPRFAMPAVAAGLIWLVLAGTASAQQETPTATVERLNDILLQVMQEADQLGYEGRYETLQPVLSEVYNFPVMAQIVVGRTNWRSLSEAQQQELVDAFTRMSIATFAARFDGYSGQSFEVVDAEPAPRGGVLVRSQLVRPEDEPVQLNYVLREFGDRWRILDVLLNGSFSEMSRQRAEFTSVLRNEGFEELISEIEGVTARLSS